MIAIIILLLLLPFNVFAAFTVSGVTDPASVAGVDEPASVAGVASDYGGGGGDVTAPQLQSATIQSTGTSIVFLFDENVEFGAGGNAGWVITPSTGSGATLSYSSGSGSSSLTYSSSRTLYSSETGTVTYTQPGNGIEDASGNDLASVGPSAFVNSSAASYCMACPDADRGADLLCEVADGTSDGACGFTVAEAGGATGDANLAGTPDNNPALGCIDIPMTYGFRFTKTNNTSGSVYVYKTVSATNWYGQLYIKFNELPANSADIHYFAGIGRSSDNYYSVRFGAYNTSGNKRFFMEYHNAAGWQNDVSTTNLSTDTWYGFRFKVINSASASEDIVQWWVDYDLDGSFTDEGETTGITLDRATEQLQFGTGTTTLYPIDYTIVGIRLDDDTMPANCAR